LRRLLRLRPLTRRLLALAFTCAHRVRRVYWRLARPRRFGVKVALTSGSEILLVRHSYAPGWSLPGGGYRPGRETPEDAARREIRQEVGVELGDLVVLGSYESTAEHKRDTVTCFQAAVARTGAASSAEISEVRWFDRDSLPADLSVVNWQALSLLRGAPDAERLPS
jgi:ADP-ribose pyrophosphatase YjhB (NUDIX family)